MHFKLKHTGLFIIVIKTLDSENEARPKISWDNNVIYEDYYN